MNHLPAVPPLELPAPPQRIVSLVPSLSESLCDLGLGARLVGITDYCVHPAEQLAHRMRVGGTKNARLADILSLKPDLVLANREENSQALVEALQTAGVPVWLTFPQTVRQALEVLWQLAQACEAKAAALRLDMLERSLEWTVAAATETRRLRYFCPIWVETAEAGSPWWMTFNQHTYPHDLLALLGGENCFAGRDRRYPLLADLGTALPEEPGTRDTRYPRLEMEEIQAARPELILLPSEPYAFGEAERNELEHLLVGTPAVENGRIHLFDGSLITWHGTRLAKALEELPQLLAG